MKLVPVVMVLILVIALGTLEILAARPAMESAPPLSTSQDWRE